MSLSPDETAYYAPGGAPFFFRGGDVGCLCLHGLTALPQEMRWLGEHLAAQGYTVCGPRIAGHGTSLHDLARTRWQDWYGSALDAYHLLRGQCRKVFVLGLSMGGTLALHLGTREQPDGVVAMAAPLEFDQPLMPYARLLKYVLPYATDGKPDENHLRIDRRMREIQAQRGEAVLGRCSYGRFPTASIAELYALMQVTAARLNRLTVPLLLIYSEGDQTVPFRNLAKVASLVGTPPEHRSQLHLTASGHLLTLDVDMEQVFRAAADFIARYAA
jgi:carboxylesterase